MDQPPPDVPDAELAVLQALWEHGDSAIRQLADRLYADEGDNGYATVQKLLERLERKGYVARDRSGHAHVFRATVDRDTLVGRRLRAVAEKLCGGLMTPLLTHLVRAEALTDEERRELRALIDELDRKGKPAK
jgi:BlaI family transcriptional regulator, penicillinase repressor